MAHANSNHNQLFGAKHDTERERERERDTHAHTVASDLPPPGDGVTYTNIKANDILHPAINTMVNVASLLKAIARKIVLLAGAIPPCAR
jgi:hypothetical protein